MLTVGELIKKLQELDPNLPVIKSRDDEGNGYQKIWNVSDDAYVADINDYFIEECPTADDVVDVDGYDDALENWTQVVVIT